MFRFNTEVDPVCQEYCSPKGIDPQCRQNYKNDSDKLVACLRACSDCGIPYYCDRKCGEEPTTARYVNSGEGFVMIILIIISIATIVSILVGCIYYCLDRRASARIRQAPVVSQMPSNTFGTNDPFTSSLNTPLSSQFSNYNYQATSTY